MNFYNGFIKPAGYALLGAAIGTASCKVLGELIEITPFMNEGLNLVKEAFSINADTGNLLAFAGFLYGGRTSFAVRQNRLNRQVVRELEQGIDIGSGLAYSKEDISKMTSKLRGEFN